MEDFKQFLSKLQHKKLAMKRFKKGKNSGNYLTKKTGVSNEFNDYRVYQRGDDIRQIDWNVYGRTKKHYIKTYLDEHMHEVGIFLDYTNSMQTNEDKWKLAKLIMASISFVTLNNEDQLQYNFALNNQLFIKKAKGKRMSHHTFQEIIYSGEHIKDQKFFEQCHKTLPKTPQMIFIISDFLEPIDTLEKLVRQMTNQHSFLYFIQVLSKEEINPTFVGDIQLTDSETNKELPISMNQALIEKYEHKLLAHNKKIELLVKKFGGNYLLCSTDQDPFELILKEFVRKEIFM